jgi:hypothetical protein
MILRYLTYAFALFSSANIYIAIGAYMTAASGIENSSPIFALILAILIFGIFSWLHFFFSQVGLAGLILFECTMLAAWPGWLWENDQQVWNILTVPCLITIVLAILAWKTAQVTGKVKWILSVPVFLLGGYLLLFLVKAIFVS